MHVHRRVQQAAGIAGSEQPLRGFLQRGEVRNLAQREQVCERRIIFQMGHHAAIVGSQEALQRQTGKELMLGELLRTTAMCIFWQRLLRGRQCSQHHRLRRFASDRHIIVTRPAQLAD